MVAYESFKNSLKIHKEKTKELKLCLMSVFVTDIQMRLNFMSNFLDQNITKSKH